MTTLFSDSFTGTNGDNLRLGAYEGSGAWTIDTNQALSSTGGAFSLCATRSTTLTAVADVKVTVKRSSAAGFDGGVAARVSNATVAGVETCYYLDMDSSVPGLAVFRRIAGVDTLLDTYNTGPFASGDIFGLEVTGTGATVTLKIWQSGVAVKTITDTNAARITAAGQVGIFSYVSAHRFDDLLVETAGASPTAYTLTAAQGSYALSGQVAALKRIRKLAAAQGSYALTGQAAVLSAAIKRLIAASGTYALLGSDARVDLQMPAASGSYTLTGQTLAERLARKVTAAQGSYALTGQPATLQGSAKILVAAQGSYALTGQTAAQRLARKVTAAQGSYSLSGQAATLSASITDDVPDQFTFNDESNVERSTVMTSNAVTISGITVSVNIGVSGGTYSLNGAPFTALQGVAVNGDQVRVRHSSSALYSTPTNTVLTVGTVSDTYTTTTRANSAEYQAGQFWSPPDFLLD